MWLIYIYVIISLVIAISAGIKVGIGTGLFAAASSLLALVAGSGLKACFLSGERSQKIVGVAIAVVLMAIVEWTGYHFSAQIFGYDLSGLVWSWVGFLVCLLFTNRKIAFA